ncbi:AAA family ATPase, partial [Deinococcus pimensis]|uniref:AAA family ATPase n=1 Tax=Deinococcus pimensis TaxID=309888 RepID=UPI0005EBC81F
MNWNSVLTTTSGPAPTVSVTSTRLVGREELLERVHAALEGPSRLVTLVGPAGVGKTAVAARFVREHMDAHPSRRVDLARLGGVRTEDVAGAVA